MFNFSGDRDCQALKPPVCEGHFCCAEKSIFEFDHADYNTCHIKCLNNQFGLEPCKWFSYDETNNKCYLYKECDDQTQQGCITGQPTCPLTY